MSNSILEEINARKRLEVAEARKKVSLAGFRDFPLFSRPACPLKEALRAPGSSGIIAEFKTKSPSKGLLHADADVTAVTSGYVAAGVAGLSVLTDEVYFGGSLLHLEKARKANPLTPVLRKDFILDPWQIYESKAFGADVILLIAASLHQDEMAELARTAKELGMEVLAEIHEEEELAKLNPDVDLVGVNNRNLKTFRVDVETSVRLGRLLPATMVHVSESGLSSAAQIRALREAGFEGFLMGETFMKTADPAKSCKEFMKEL